MDASLDTNLIIHLYKANLLLHFMKFCFWIS